MGCKRRGRIRHARECLEFSRNYGGKSGSIGQPFNREKAKAVLARLGEMFNILKRDENERIEGRGSQS
jgi:hypothetical protein